MINIDTVAGTYLPNWAIKRPLLLKPIVSFLRMLCHEKELQQFEADFPHIEGIDFVEHVLAYFNFSYTLRSNEIERVPTSGRLVIVANHPIGSLDGLALLKFIYSIRKDVKVVGNEVLSHLKPLDSLLLPVDNIHGRTARGSIKAIDKHLNNEGAVIIFPAGEVSRFGPKGIKDGAWNSGFVRFANRASSPVLPLFVDGRNSTFFYSLSLIAKPISTLWLIREMFKQVENHVAIRVGEVIEHNQYAPLTSDRKKLAKHFRKHVYDIGRGKKLRYFDGTTTAIAHPENRADLINELRNCEKLGQVGTDKDIYLFQHQSNSVVMREIGRLREISFRAVGEGSGKRLDIDHFDRDYDHVVLWDRNHLEIIGAYRMRRTSSMGADTSQAKPNLYSETLFTYHDSFKPYLANGLELGRSFIQPKYWNKRNLDILWFGIGAYLKRHPDIRYLFGPVTLSDEMPGYAKDLIVAFYHQHFKPADCLASAKHPYHWQNKPPETDSSAISESLHYGDARPEQDAIEVDEERFYKSAFRDLKAKLAEDKLSIPTLYKQYSELCCPGGVKFLAFNVDQDFANCVDGLVLVDLEKLKDNKRKRYMN
jgi:putative hemolysin